MVVLFFKSKRLRTRCYAEEMITQELARVWGIAVAPTYAGTLRGTGCYRGSQVGAHGHVGSASDTVSLPRCVSCCFCLFDKCLKLILVTLRRWCSVCYRPIAPMSCIALKAVLLGPVVQKSVSLTLSKLWPNFFFAHFVVENLRIFLFAHLGTLVYRLDISGHE